MVRILNTALPLHNLHAFFCLRNFVSILSGRSIVLELALAKVLVVLSGILVDCLTLEHQLWHPGDVCE